MEQILFRAMGCEIFCGIDSRHPCSRERLERAPAMFEAWEQTLSRFRADSELAQLNARAGETVCVSDSLWRVLQWAQRAEKMSAGLITPTIHDALRASGYEHSFDARRAFKRSGAASPLPITVAHAWTLHPTRRAVTLAPHTHLDLNGVAKGWAAEQTANYLGELGPALVDTGGDMVMTAPRAVGAPWHIGIEDAFHPEHENKRLPLLAIARGATATSGRNVRKWTRDGKAMHHLIDPRTGLPAVTDVMCATVIAPTILQAEVAAKVVLVLGSARGLEWLAARPWNAALLILEDGTIMTNEPMERFII